MPRRLSGPHELRVADLLSACQRWDRRRTSYRPPGEPFDSSRYDVDIIGYQEAGRFIEETHYSASYVASRMQVVLWRKPSPFQREQLAGVIAFSVAIQNATITAWFSGVPANEGFEIGRVGLLDHVPGNGETFMLGRAFRLLRRTLPEVRAVLSYADPMERHDAAGKVIKCSHRGTINAAFSGVYLGRPSARPLILARDGRYINDRTPEQAAQRGMRRGLCRTPVGRHGRSCAPHVREGRGQRHARLAVRRVPACTNPGNYAFGWWLSHPNQNPLPSRGATPYPRDTCTDRDPRLAHLMGEARDVA